MREHDVTAPDRRRARCRPARGPHIATPARSGSATASSCQSTEERPTGNLVADVGAPVLPRHPDGKPGRSAYTGLQDLRTDGRYP
jgi:hypothetical protein